MKKAARKGLLPSWWAETEAESMATLCEMAVTHEWHNIKYAAEKSDMLEHYNMLELPMLRALAEKVRGPVFGYGDESDDDYDDDYGSDDGDEEWVTTGQVTQWMWKRTTRTVATVMARQKVTTMAPPLQHSATQATCTPWLRWTEADCAVS